MKKTDPFDLDKILAALDTATHSDEPEDKKAAKALTKALTPHLEALREFITELDGYLDSAEQATTFLADADGDDREGMHTDWSGSTTDLREHLLDLRPASQKQ